MVHGIIRYLTFLYIYIEILHRDLSKKYASLEYNIFKYIFNMLKTKFRLEISDKMFKRTIKRLGFEGKLSWAFQWNVEKAKNIFINGEQLYLGKLWRKNENYRRLLFDDTRH